MRNGGKARCKKRRKSGRRETKRKKRKKEGKEERNIDFGFWSSFVILQQTFIIKILDHILNPQIIIYNRDR